MTAVVWLVAAIVLAVAEVVSGDLFLLMLAGASLATAGAVQIFDVNAWIQAAIFATTGFLLVWGLRPVLLRRLRVEPTAAGIEALEGKSALVLDAVSAHSGQIKFDGEVWTARPIDELDQYPPGETVQIMRIEGATALVWKEP